MPKDEVDPEDPLELCGVGLVTAEDTGEIMAECFIEEFLRLGHSADQILALFRNSHYIGMNMVLQNRGEEFVKAKIMEVFGWWQREVPWPVQASGQEKLLPTGGEYGSPGSPERGDSATGR